MWWAGVSAVVSLGLAGRRVGPAAGRGSGRGPGRWAKLLRLGWPPASGRGSSQATGSVGGIGAQLAWLPGSPLEVSGPDEQVRADMHLEPGTGGPGSNPGQPLPSGPATGWCWPVRVERNGGRLRHGPHRGAGAAGPGPGAGLPAAGAIGQPSLCGPGRPGRGGRRRPAAGRNPAGAGPATGQASLPRPGNRCRGLAVSGSAARGVRGAGPQPQLHRPHRAAYDPA